MLPCRRLPFLTVRSAIDQGADLLRSAGVAEPRLTAELILCHARNCDRPSLFAHPDRELLEVEWIHYGRWLDERMRGKPLQYITQIQEFYGRPFRVTPDVLIPRPETELIVEALLKHRPQRILDIGTGSGAIAISLALELDLGVTATDISSFAANIARSNADSLSAHVSVFVADLATPFRDASFDVVVSNPPYVAQSDAPTLQREVRDWEPAVALFAGDSGLDVYSRLIPEARRVLKPGGLLALELGYGQASAVSSLAADWNGVQIIDDLAGIPRVLLCTKP